MMMTVKRSYLIQLKNILERPENVFEGTVSGEIRYMVSMNFKTAKEVFDAVLQAFPFDPKYLEYQEKHRACLGEYGIASDADYLAKDEETRNTISERLNALAAEYKDVIEAETEVGKERDAFLDKEVEVNLEVIDPSRINLKDQNGWAAWDILFNDGNGIVRK